MRVQGMDWFCRAFSACAPHFSVVVMSMRAVKWLPWVFAKEGGSFWPEAVMKVSMSLRLMGVSGA